YGPNAKVGSNGENASNYTNPEFDRLFERMKNMADGPVRQALVDQLLEIVRRDAPWIWGYYPMSYSLHHAWYHNGKPNQMANNTLKYRRIDAVQRAQRRSDWNQPVLWPVALVGGLIVISVLPAFAAYRRRERGRAL
ncbi:MAG: ABC transporter substrate-binding protein, partial [Burkholderiales bacterium]